MPSEYIGKDGFLVTPQGDSYDYQIRRKKEPGILGRLVELMVPRTSQEFGSGSRCILKILNENRNKFNKEDFPSLSKIASDIIQKRGRYIDIGYGREDDLPHEAFHSIQGFLAENHPTMYDKLNGVAQSKKEAFAKIYKKSPLSKSRGAYDLKHMIESMQSTDLSELPYGYATDHYEERNKLFSRIERQVASEFGKDELIPQLMTMATKYEDKKAQQLLSDIFSEAGLRADFIEQNLFLGMKDWLR